MSYCGLMIHCHKILGDGNSYYSKCFSVEELMSYCGHGIGGYGALKFS